MKLSTLLKKKKIIIEKKNIKMDQIKPRGRPRKVLTKERGRPRKRPVLENSVSSVEKDSDFDQKPKKPRGRPRKQENIIPRLEVGEENEVPSTEKESDSDQQTESTKKGHRKLRNPLISAEKETDFNNKILIDQDKRFDFLLKQTEIIKQLWLDGEDEKYKTTKPKNSNSIADFKQFETSPDYIKNGTMRDYQVVGLNWLISLYENGINGILADEMGLGKTIQTIAFLGYLMHFKNQPGPHIVIVPKSTLQNWMNEISRWCPSLRAVCLIGTKLERNAFKSEVLFPGDWNVCVTSYEMCLIEKSALTKYKWHCLVLDEAHRIKNEKTLLAEVLRTLKVSNRVLLTGTPLQNNLHELWAIFNFMLPDVFSSAETFDAWFDTNKCLKDNAMVKQLHSILKVFMLRRLKSVVEKDLLPKKEIKVFVGLSKMQRDWYTKILLKDIHIVNSSAVGQGNRLLHILMHLRKCTMHPYLFHGAEAGPPYTTDFHIVQNSGKMLALDKMLVKLKAQGSRVLIFSQMTRMMDILEDYCIWRKYEYCRLDGQTAHTDRDKLMQEYNKKNRKKFIFLLSTRAGGLGINLATADVVIFYDSDFNPQMDLQAMDRAHRIGQKKQVRVFRLITANTVDEKMVQRAEIKLHIDREVIQRGTVAGAAVGSHFNMNSRTMLDIIRFGANQVFATKDSELTDEDIDLLLERGETKTKAQQDTLDKMDFESLEKLITEPESTELTPMLLYQFEGEDYREKQKLNVSDESFEFIELPKRGNRNPIKPLPPNLNVVYDFQFFPQRLYHLQNKEINYYLKTINYHVPHNTLYNTTNRNIEELLQPQLEEQRAINEALPLTAVEKNEMKSLLKEGFITWTKENFTQFTNAFAQYPRRTFVSIFNCVPGKATEEVIDYAKVFWERYEEIKNLRYIKYKNVLKKLMANYLLLSQKITQYENPFEELKIKYFTEEDKDEHFSEAEDRIIVCTLQKFGFDEKHLDKVLDAACAYKNLPADSYIKSCSIEDFTKRCHILVELIEKEMSEVQNERKDISLRSTKNKSNDISLRNSKNKSNDISLRKPKNKSNDISLRKPNKEMKDRSLRNPLTENNYRQMRKRPVDRVDKLTKKTKLIV